MKPKRHIITILAGVALLLVLILGMIGRHSSSTKTLNNSSSKDANAGSSVSASDNPVSRITPITASAISESRAAREEAIQEFPDDYYDPTRSDPDYMVRVERHYRIGEFLESDYAGEPRFRKVMTLLLENGYGLSEWAPTMAFLIQFHSPVTAARKRMERLGYSPQDIEEGLGTKESPEIGTARWRRNRQFGGNNGGAHEVFRSMGITEMDVVDHLLAIDLSEMELIGDVSGAIGQTQYTTQRGDRLYVDDDWMDEEFRQAQNRYQGSPKNTPFAFDPHGGNE